VCCVWEGVEGVRRIGDKILERDGEEREAVGRMSPLPGGVQAHGGYD